jgi:hypothetical protein
MNNAVSATPRITPFNSSEGHLGALVNVGGSTTSTFALHRDFRDLLRHGSTREFSTV